LQAPLEISGFRHSSIIVLASYRADGLQSIQRTQMNDGE
jgi:hypothetical protein